jgi:putative two-component system hydrogenase maturation factor HypX/HoxX
MKKITLLITSFNGLSQAIYCWLIDNDYLVDITYAKSKTLNEEIKSFNPDLILSPFLKDFISSDIYENYQTFVFHPGIIGDRGAYSIEWALWNNQTSWGGVWLKANELFDGGDIYANGIFDLRDTTKASVYRIEEKSLALDLLPNLLENIKNNNSKAQKLNDIHDKFSVTINWEEDSTNVIVKKINTLDSFPGLKDEILGIQCYLYGAWKEENIAKDIEISPKTILAKRDGAICISTIDGAIWISHLKELNRFKLPATYCLKDKLKGIKEDRLPLVFDKSYKTFYEISCDIKNDIGYLTFNFHNGAFRSEQCIRLKYAIEYLKTQVKVLVLMGGDDFFSNGINLNILEDSKKSGEDGWSNINAINDLVSSIIYADNIITIASLTKNVGAGGVFLATACDFVVASNDVVLNPHYKTLGLSGSEYHTYSLPKRVGDDIANRLLNQCLPISATYAKNIGLVDTLFDKTSYKSDLEEFCEKLIDNEDNFDSFIWDKEDYLEENRSYIESCKENEIKIMYDEFWDKNSEFHKLRYDFVHKICPINTPKRLKI